MRSRSGRLLTGISMVVLVEVALLVGFGPGLGVGELLVMLMLGVAAIGLMFWGVGRG